MNAFHKKKDTQCVDLMQKRSMMSLFQQTESLSVFPRIFYIQKE